MYTKGEWKVEYQQYEDGSHICVADQYGDWVADCGREGHLEAEDNANLIAAAPDMHKALTDIINYFRRNFYLTVADNDVLDVGSEAIAKAEGGDDH